MRAIRQACGKTGDTDAMNDSWPALVGLETVWVVVGPCSGATTKEG